MLITREIQIDAGHRLASHGGMCKGLHGHRYRLVCTVVGTDSDVPEERGMVVDFSTLKRFMVEEVHNVCDHALMMEGTDPLVATLAGTLVAAAGEVVCKAGEEDVTERMTFPLDDGTRLVLLPCPPTAERLAEHWGERLHRRIVAHSEGRCEVFEFVVWETPNCSASWTPPMPEDTL